MTDRKDGARGPGSSRWEEAVCAALVLAPDAGDEELRAARDTADRLTEDRRVFVINLTGPDSEMDRLLGVGGRGGLEAVRRGERKLGQATLRPPERRFLYLPSGSAAPGPEGAEERRRPVEDPSVVAAVRRLKEKIREAGGLLVLLLREEDLAGLDPGIVDREMRVGELPPGPEPGPESDRVAPRRRASGPEGVVGPRGEAGRPSREAGNGVDPTHSGATSHDEDREASSWRRHRRSEGVPIGRIVAAALFLAVLAVGWWWLARGSADSGSPGTGPGGPRAADTAAPPAGAGASDTAPTAASDPVADDTGAAPTVPEEAPELSYSVLVASYTSFDAARERIGEWGGGELYFVAPTPVGGRVYWRVFDGAVADREAAGAINRKLVDRGVKDTAAAWDVRPAGLAFRIGVFGSREAAAARLEELRRRGLPGYLLPAGRDGTGAWQVYAGAYETPEAAAELGRRLREAGIESELVTRRGEPTTR